MGVLHLWTIKSPTASAFISHKGNSYQAIEIAEGVNEKRCIKKDLKIFYVVHLEDSYAKMTKKRHRKKWTTSEELDLQREYELLELTVQEIAEIHKRTEEAIMCKLQKEGYIDTWLDARGYQEFAKDLPVLYDPNAYQDVQSSQCQNDKEDNEKEETDDHVEESKDTVCEQKETCDEGSQEETIEQEPEEKEPEKETEEKEIDDMDDNEDEETLEEETALHAQEEEKEEEFIREEDGQEPEVEVEEEGGVTRTDNIDIAEEQVITTEEEWVNTNQPPTPPPANAPARGILNTIFSYFSWR